MAQGLPRGCRFEMLMLAGGDGIDAACSDAAMRRWLQRAAQAGRARITSICSGSLLLAAAGLLDGRAATTHWSRTRASSSSAYPQVRLQPDRIWVHDPRIRTRPIWTSAGMTAGIDLCLALLAHDHGEALAREAARSWWWTGGGRAGSRSFRRCWTCSAARAALARCWTMCAATWRATTAWKPGGARLHEPAPLCALLPAAETGATPAQAVERLRVEAARAALDSGASSVQQVARDCGFGNTDRMRRAFQRLLGQPPSGSRRAARRPADT
jgi:transcriptional regulator GlxA family with amidase domain